jgi:hypothetical protein
VAAALFGFVVSFGNRHLCCGVDAHTARASGSRIGKIASIQPASMESNPGDRAWRRPAVH